MRHKFSNKFLLREVSLGGLVDVGIIVLLNLGNLSVNSSGSVYLCVVQHVQVFEEIIKRYSFRYYKQFRPTYLARNIS